MNSNDPRAKAKAETTTVVERAKQMKEYINATKRKVEIAEYHLGCLLSALAAWKPPDEPSVPIQAHFEGILYSVIAASEQVKKVTDCEPARIFRCDLNEWLQESIVEDIRAVRNKATHHHYQKAPAGLRLEVQKVSYDGPRALNVYSEAACEHLRRLRPLLDGIESVLSASAVE